MSCEVGCSAGLLLLQEVVVRRGQCDSPPVSCTMSCTWFASFLMRALHDNIRYDGCATCLSIDKSVPKVSILKLRGLRTLGCAGHRKQGFTMLLACCQASSSAGIQLAMQQHPPGAMRPPLEVGACCRLVSCLMGRPSKPRPESFPLDHLSDRLASSPTLLPCADL